MFKFPFLQFQECRSGSQLLLVILRKGTLGNAFLRSTKMRKTPKSFPFVLRKHSRTRRTTKRPSADPCSGRNPTCVSGTSLSDRYLSALLSNKACILDAMLRSTIPRQLFQSLRAPFLLYKGIRIASNHDVGISSPFQSL